MKELHPGKSLALLGAIVAGVCCLAIRSTATYLADPTPPADVTDQPLCKVAASIPGVARE